MLSQRALISDSPLLLLHHINTLAHIHTWEQPSITAARYCFATYCLYWSNWGLIAMLKGTSVVAAEIEGGHSSLSFVETGSANAA